MQEGLQCGSEAVRIEGTHSSQSYAMCPWPPYSARRAHCWFQQGRWHRLPYGPPAQTGGLCLLNIDDGSALWKI